jgi:hypothetical protein
MNWTRAHDAWIAEHCEGLEVSTEFGAEPHEIRFNGPWKPVAAYNTDPAACIRAAEAWRKKVVGRSYRVFSAMDHADNCEPETAYFDGPCRSPISSAEGPFALAQALYRATGGPA